MVFLLIPATAKSCGLTIEDIHQHLLANVEGLTSISRNKVYNLKQPVKSSTIEATRHKNAVDIRISTKQCDISRENKQAHEYFAFIFCVPTSLGDDTGKKDIMKCHQNNTMKMK